MILGSIDHLTCDAVVAYADGEMSMVSYQRAAAHVYRCPQCDAEVRAQVAARARLQSAQAPPMPTSLLDALRSIPVALPAIDNTLATDNLPAPGEPPGHLAGGGHGTLTPHQRNAHRSRRFRFLGTGALVAGLTVSALVGVEPAAETDGHPDSPHIAHVSPATASQVVTAGWGTP